MLDRLDFEITHSCKVTFVGDLDNLCVSLECPNNLTCRDLLDLLSCYFDFYQPSLCKSSLVRIFTDFINGDRKF